MPNAAGFVCAIPFERVRISLRKAEGARNDEPKRHLVVTTPSWPVLGRSTQTGSPMALLPIQAAAQLLPIGVAAQAAVSTVSAVSAGFADLLDSAMSKPSEVSSEKSSTGLGESSAGNQPLNVSRIKTDAAEQVSRFQQQLVRLFAEQGIDVENGVQLQLDSLGKVRVVGDHPQKAEIESLFVQHPDLADSFRGLSARATLLKAIEETTSSQHADSIAAPKVDTSASHSDASPRFTLFVNAQRADVAFV